MYEEIKGPKRSFSTSNNVVNISNTNKQHHLNTNILYEFEKTYQQTQKASEEFESLPENSRNVAHNDDENSD